MKVCVFGAASSKIDKRYIKIAKQLGEKLVRGGHSLIFGAGATGLMGAVAEGAKSHGGYIHGIVPTFFEEEGFDVPYSLSDRITLTADIAERKKKMYELSDVFIVLPGGIGTLEEFFEVVSLKQFCRHDKKIILFNIEGYYDDFINFIRKCEKDGFILGGIDKLFSDVNSVDGIVSLLDKY